MSESVAQDGSGHIRSAPPRSRTGLAMAPKAASPAGKKASDTKAATKVLDSAQAVKTLATKRAELKEAMAKLQVAKKKEERKMKNLKKKASKLDLSDLMQMLMMKAFYHAKAEAETSSSSSSSTAVWVPKNGADAVERLKELAETCQHPEVMAFAKTLKENGATPASAFEAGEASED